MSVTLKPMEGKEDLPTTVFDGESGKPGHCPGCKKNIVFWSDLPTFIGSDGLLHWACPCCGAKLLEDANCNLKLE